MIIPVASPAPGRPSSRDLGPGLIVLIGVIGVCLGWLVRGVRVQREAVHAIEQTGGSVAYDWDSEADQNRPAAIPGMPLCGNTSVFEEVWSRPDAMPRWPRCLIDVLGVDYFRNAVAARISTQGTDADLINLECLSRLKGVELANLPITDAGLVHLRTLRCLEVLNMNDTRVSDAGLANLKRLASLRKLCLNHTLVTDTGLAHLNELTRLEMLVPGWTRITDAGLVHLKGMTRLQELYLRNCAVSDVGLAHLKGLTKLQLLDIRETGVTVVGIKELRAALPQLAIAHSHRGERGAR